MPKSIYNLGRVVGYSSYETYVRHHQAENDTPPASERQWLASSLAMGTAMLLRLDVDTNHKDDEIWSEEIQFPNNTRIGAANTIIASYFDGQGEYAGNWANRVSDYGSLISNTASSSPNGKVDHSGNVPMKSDVTSPWTDAKKEEFAQYLKIIDGIIIQPGTWSDSQNKPPQKDFSPDLSDYPRIRLQIRGPITKQVQILLTGFSLRTVVEGESGLDGATATPSPEDGDFLGPGQFPWAAKVLFTVPSSYAAYFASGAYTRQLPTTAEKLTLKDAPIIDMGTTKPETYYLKNYSDARIQLNVNEYNTLGEGDAVLSIYQKKDKYPPALYGTFVDSTGLNYLNPIDVVAPGTIKMFPNGSESDLKEYEDTFSGTHGMTRNDDGTVGILDENGKLVPMADVTTIDLTHPKKDADSVSAKAVVTQTGNRKEISLSMGPGVGTADQYTIGDNPGTALVATDDNIYWGVLLEALANNRTIDILGLELKKFKRNLPDIVSEGVLNLSGTGASSVGGSFSAGGAISSGGAITAANNITGDNITSRSGYHIKTGKQYIEFNDGLRLYISKNPPSSSDDGGIPIGSIGIGWGFD